LIRVNLLPHTREARAAPEASQVWLLAVMGIIVLEIVGLFFYHQTKEDELNAIKADASQLSSQINDIKKLVKDHKKVKAELAVLEARQDAIAKLEQGKTGPTAVLLELSRILTPGKGPTLKLATASKPSSLHTEVAYNPVWDARRVWLTRFEESERTVKLEGMARDGSDVYELAQRLKLSKYFDDVQLLPGRQKREKVTKVELVNFALQVKVKY